MAMFNSFLYVYQAGYQAPGISFQPKVHLGWDHFGG